MCCKSIAIVALVAFVIPMIPSVSFCQEAEQQDVVYLKNGSIIRGVIIEQIPEESVKIRTADGSVFVYQMSEVERITKEAPVAGQPTKPTKSKKEPALACVLSFLLPGLGQFYNGEAGKGAIMLGASFFGVILMASAINDELWTRQDSDAKGTFGVMIFLGAWLWSVIDAPISASKINRDNGWTSLPLIDEDLAVKFSDLAVGGKTTPGIKFKWSF
jgi:TM2 domain-containing membrane protein YozV